MRKRDLERLVVDREEARRVAEGNQQAADLALIREQNVAIELRERYAACDTARADARRELSSVSTKLASARLEAEGLAVDVADGLHWKQKYDNAADQWYVRVGELEDQVDDLGSRLEAVTVDRDHWLDASKYDREQYDGLKAAAHERLDEEKALTLGLCSLVGRWRERFVEQADSTAEATRDVTFLVGQIDGLVERAGQAEADNRLDIDMRREYFREKEALGQELEVAEDVAEALDAHILDLEAHFEAELASMEICVEQADELRKQVGLERDAWYARAMAAEDREDKAVKALLGVQSQVPRMAALDPDLSLVGWSYGRTC